MLDELDAVHFPDDGVVTRQGLCKIRSGWLVAHGQEFKMTAPWLPQTHLDYLTLKQELYGPEAVLTVRMQKLLATLITSNKERPVYQGLKLSDFGGFMHTSADDLLVHLQMQDSAMEIGKNAKAGLVLQAWRLTANTFLVLFPWLQTKSLTAEESTDDNLF